MCVDMCTLVAFVKLRGRMEDVYVAWIEQMKPMASVGPRQSEVRFVPWWRLLAWNVEFAGLLMSGRQLGGVAPVMKC